MIGAFRDLAQDALYDLLVPVYDGMKPSLSPVPTSIVIRFILRACSAENADQRPLCRAIEQVIEARRLSDWSILVTADECRYRLATAAANSLLLCDVLANLRPLTSSSPSFENSLVVMLIVAAGQIGRLELDSMDGLASLAVQNTRFFGCALSSAARLGMAEVTELFFHRLDPLNADPARSQSVNMAFEQAAANNQLEVIATIFSRSEGSRSRLCYETAIKAAVRCQHEDAALAILQYEKLSPDTEGRILRLAAAYGCVRVVEALQSASLEWTDGTAAVDVSLEVACRYSQTQIVRTICRARQVTSLATPFFWSAYNGNLEILGVLRQHEHSRLQLVDALAGAFVGEQWDTVDYLLDSSAYTGTTVTGGFAEATHLLLDQKCDVTFCYQPVNMPQSSVKYNSATYEHSSTPIQWNADLLDAVEPIVAQQACEDGSLGGVRDAIVAFRGRHPDHSLDVFSGSCSVAASTSQAGVLYYLCQHAVSYILPHCILDSNSTAIMQIAFALGWDINWATGIASTPLLGFVRPKFLSQQLT